MAKFTVEAVEEMVYGIAMKGQEKYAGLEYDAVLYDGTMDYVDTMTYFLTYFNRQFVIFANPVDGEIEITKTTYKDVDRRDEVAESTKTVKTLKGLKGYLAKEIDNEDLI